jgi:hypothetical protein
MFYISYIHINLSNSLVLTCVKQWVPSLQVQSITGIVTSYTSKAPFLFEASRLSLALVELRRGTPQKDTVIVEGGEGVDVLCMQSLLSVAAPYVKRAKPLCTRADVTQEEIKNIEVANLATPIPEGWFFDGKVSAR